MRFPSFSGAAQPLSEQDVSSLYCNVCPLQSASAVVRESTDLSPTVIIVNGLTSLGAEFAQKLSTTEWKVLSVASINERYCGDELMWTHHDRLRASGMNTLFIDLSNDSAIVSLLQQEHPKHIVYIPPDLDGHSSWCPLDASKWASNLHRFVALLEAVRTVSPTTRLTLASVSKSRKNELDMVRPSDRHMELLESLVGAFELSLSTYHTLYHIPFSVLRLKGFSGPWTRSGLNAMSHHTQDIPMGCYVDDVVQAFHNSLLLHSMCVVLDLGPCQHIDNEYHAYAWSKLNIHQLTTVGQGMQLTKEWQVSYRDRKATKGQLILTSYFTGDGFHKAPNKYKNLLKWVESISNLGLSAVVLHNGLDQEFVLRATNLYSKLSFKSVTLPAHAGHGSCMPTVQAFADYLENHDELQRVVVMDLTKTVEQEPFPIMELLGDWIYSDLDLIPFRDVLSPAQNGAQSESSSLSSGMVVGGNRHIVLATLNKMAKCLTGERTEPQVSTLQCVMDEEFVRHAFLGFPFSTSIGSMY